MALVLSQFRNPWGAPAAHGLAEPSLDTARTDLWTLDMNYVAAQLYTRLPLAYKVDSAVNSIDTYTQIKQALPTGSLAAYMARSVQLPSRVTGAGQGVRRDNGIFVAPGYAEGIGKVQVTFAHELAKSYVGSTIWALLTVWRAFARAGQGPDFPGTDDLTFSLSGASFTGFGGTKTLNPAFMYDFAMTLASPVTGNDKGVATSANGTTLKQGAGYVVKNAWPLEFGIEPVTYEGSKILELKAVFQCSDVLPEF